MSEARVLGLETMVHVARIREKVQRRKGRYIDGVAGLANGVAKDESGHSGLVNAPALLKNSNSAAPATPSSNLDNAKGAEAEMTEKYGALASVLLIICMLIETPS